MRTVRIATLGSLLVVALTTACGSSPPPEPAVAEDRTANPDGRKTKLTQCGWVPQLPSDREDPCDHYLEGTELEITERDDMRKESASTSTSTCVCN